MGKAVQFDSYGGIDVLEVRDVERPVPGAGEVLVEVKAAGINPGEAIDPAGRLCTTVGLRRSRPDKAVTSPAWSPKPVRTSTPFTVGDEVIGFTDQRASQAEFVVVPADQVTPKPDNVTWEVAGALFVAGTTAYAAVRAVALQQGETVAVAGAAGGVGTIAVQLAKRCGRHRSGHRRPVERRLARRTRRRSRSITATAWRTGCETRRPTGRIDAFLDFFGGGYVELAVTELGIDPAAGGHHHRFPGHRAVRGQGRGKRRRRRRRRAGGVGGVARRR